MQFSRKRSHDLNLERHISFCFVSETLDSSVCRYGAAGGTREMYSKQSFSRKSHWSCCSDLNVSSSTSHVFHCWHLCNEPRSQYQQTSQILLEGTHFLPPRSNKIHVKFRLPDNCNHTICFTFPPANNQS